MLTYHIISFLSMTLSEFCDYFILFRLILAKLLKYILLVKIPFKSYIYFFFIVLRKLPPRYGSCIIILPSLGVKSDILDS